MNSRGGMCRNPFGGRTRLDRLDFTGLAKGCEQKVLYLQTITDAVHNYLFFGLGRNGTTAEEFAYACEYLFHIRASDASTWPADADKLDLFLEGSAGPGKPTVVSVDLTDCQLMAMCFDTHYEFSGLSNHMPMDKFLTWLVRTRTQIITDNAAQVDEYLNYMYSRACQAAKPGHQLPLPMFDRHATLIRPSSPADVARLMYLPKKYRVSPQTRHRAKT